MELTICSETLFTHLPLFERFSRIRSFGVSGIELWGLPTSIISSVEEGLEASGCKLKLFCGNRASSLIDSEERNRFLVELKQSMQNAKRLSCSQLTILSDQVDNKGIPIPPAKPLTLEQKTNSIVDGLKHAVELAESAKIMLLLEPLNTKVDHPGFTLARSAQAFEIVRWINSPWLKVLYDIYHMQIMEGDLITTIEKNLDAIGHLHVADVPGRHEPGTGEINYPNIVRALKMNGYNRSIGLECVPSGRSELAIESFIRTFS